MHNHNIIRDWLRTECYIQQPIKIDSLAGDASARQYYRCHLGLQSYIVMHAAGDDSLSAFVQIAEQLKNWSLQVPVLHKVDEHNSMVLMGDLGDDLYYHKLNTNTAGNLYSAAIDDLLVMQQGVLTDGQQLPKMNADYIAEKLAVFQQWFLVQYLGIAVTEKIQVLLQDLAKLFLEVFMLQPQSFVHLDYHSKNLLVLANGVKKPGILDFQDAMRGPIAYDLVSLLQDAYITWPREQVQQWLTEYQQKAIATGLITMQQSKLFVRSFDLVGVQRHLKNLGVFARLYHRDDKAQYLEHIPTLLKYILAAGAEYRELSQLKLFFDEQVIPQFELTTEKLLERQCKQ